MTQRGVRSSRFKQAVRAVIAVIVVAGLIGATARAVEQWNAQRDAVAARLVELDRQIQREPDPGRRRVLLERRGEVAESVPRLAGLQWSWIAAGCLCYAFGLLPGAMVLLEATRALGYRVPIGEAVRAQVIGHLGKYVPGKAMVVVIRAGRLAGLGVPVVAGSTAVFLETVLMMAIGAALAGLLVFWLPVPRWIGWTALVGGILATAPTLPPVLKRLVARLGSGPRLPPPSGDRRPSAGEAGAEPAAAVGLDHDWRFFSLAWFWQLSAWLLIGGSFACLVWSVPGLPSGASGGWVFLAAVASIALAMVVGFASLLPGGAGVRELVLAIVLAPAVGQSQALVAAILARLVFLVVEVSGALALIALGRSWANR